MVKYRSNKFNKEVFVFKFLSKLAIAGLLVSIFLSGCVDNGKNEEVVLPVTLSIGDLQTGQQTSYLDYDDGYYKKGFSRDYERECDSSIVTDMTTALVWQDNEGVSHNDKKLFASQLVIVKI